MGVVSLGFLACEVRVDGEEEVEVILDASRFTPVDDSTDWLLFRCCCCLMALILSQSSSNCFTPSIELVLLLNTLVTLRNTDS